MIKFRVLGKNTQWIYKVEMDKINTKLTTVGLRGSHSNTISTKDFLLQLNNREFIIEQ